VGFLYRVGSFLGFSARLNDGLLKAELAHPDVKYIECDQVVSLNVQDPRAPLAIVTQTGATWGLDRISKRNLPLNGQYVYNSAGGSGVDVYVLDTGISETHVDFGARVQSVFNAISGESPTDLNGHGTAVAGVIGGTTYGVAKQASLKSVKVLSASGSGSTAGIISGVDYVTNNRTKGRPAVANMSLGGPVSAPLMDAVAQSIASGVVYVVAAGNSNTNACTQTPANVPDAIAVGSTTSVDARASASNIGTCVALFAPGQSITTDWIGSNTATNTLSGTSFAAAFVAGAIAVSLSVNSTLTTPAAAKAWLLASATPNIITNVGTGSPNLLLYSPPN